MQMILAATMEPMDTLLCCSLTGRSTELIRVVSIAAQYGASTVALTTAATPLARAAALALPDDGDVLGPTSMRYGFMVAIDIWHTSLPCAPSPVRVRSYAV
jgi:RpiR family carbohydrate utilization transcriptional regulator